MVLARKKSFSVEGGAVGERPNLIGWQKNFSAVEEVLKFEQSFFLKHESFFRSKFFLQQRQSFASIHPKVNINWRAREPRVRFRI